MANQNRREDHRNASKDDAYHRDDNIKETLPETRHPTVLGKASRKDWHIGDIAHTHLRTIHIGNIGGQCQLKSLRFGRERKCPHCARFARDNVSDHDSVGAIMLRDLRQM